MGGTSWPAMSRVGVSLGSVGMKKTGIDLISFVVIHLARGPVKVNMHSDHDVSLGNRDSQRVNSVYPYALQCWLIP